MTETPIDETSKILPIGLAFLRSLALPRKLGFLEKIYGKNLASCGIATVRLANGYVWTIDCADVTHRWLVYGDYEGPLQMGWIKGWLSAGGVFIDSGANIGQMVVSLSHLPGVQTWAFEPVASERAWLQSCLERYSEWRVHVIPCGLSDLKQERMIRLAGGRSTLRTDWYLSRELAEESVELITLDSFAESQNLNRIRLWKLDMEGHEVEALAGARKLLSAQRIDALLIEVQTSTIPEIVEQLSYSGYCLYRLEALGKLQSIVEAESVNGFNGNFIALPR